MTNKIKMPAQTSKQCRTLIFIGLVYLICLLSFLSCNSNNKTAPPPVPKTDSVSVINDTLQSQFNAASTHIDELASKISVLDSQVRLKDAEIEKLKSKVSHLNKSNKLLTAKVNKDKRFIASLKDEFSEKARSFAERLGLLDAQKNSLTSQLDSLMAKYDRLKMLGSVLHASNIRLAALHLKHHGRKEKKTARARKTDILRIYFDIDENRVAEDGTKKLYLSIVDPEGHLLKSATGSGVTEASNGTPLDYSLLKQIPLKQDEPVKDVTVDWKQKGDYEKGTYKIAIFNGGYKIGSGDVVLN
jgi:peptidoglycan hydrolase CwlO-like protein